MRRPLALALVLATLLAAPGFAQEEPAASASVLPSEDASHAAHGVRVGPNAGVIEELRALRRAAEQQSKQLDAIAQQLTRLNQHLSGGQSTAPDPGSSVARSPFPAPPESAVAPPPAPATSAPGETPKAEPVIAAAVPGPKHTVAKGETLTSIAKRYNIPIPELQKANNIKDDRKLQIGQVLTLPAGTQASAPQEPSEPSTTSTDKKENR